jgi:YD repeat-containing protein
MRRSRNLLLGALLLLSPSLLAQRLPNEELGFQPGKLYEFHGLDSVNLFNGNLIVAVPLGFRQQVGSSLSYQFMLVYNAKIYDWEWTDCTLNDEPRRCNDSFPSRRSNAGLGWRMSLGRLLPPESPTVNHREPFRGSWIYESPAGDEHELWVHQQGSSTYVSYTAGIRMTTDSNNPNKRKLEFQNGEVHEFELLNQEWRLTRMRRFNDWVKIDYEYFDGFSSDFDPRRERSWTITDSASGRSNRVSFAFHPTMSDGWSRGAQVGNITIRGVGGAPLTYAFQYSIVSTTSPSPRLLAVNGNDGTSYLMAYNSLHYLQKITYPTRGSTEYTYVSYQMSELDDCSEVSWGSGGMYGTLGIASRKVSDGSTTRTWNYVQRRGPKVPMEYTSQDPCQNWAGWTYGPGTPPYGPFYWSRTSVLEPANSDGTRTRIDHYFNLWGGPRQRTLHGTPTSAVVDLNAELPYGYPMTAARPPVARESGSITEVPEETVGYPVDVSSEVDSRYLSTRVYEKCSAEGDCSSGTLLRSTYGTYEEAPPFEFNWQRSSTRTVHEDDAGCGGTCYTQTTSLDWDLAGRYRETLEQSNIPGTPTVRTRTDYPVWASRDALYDLNRPWVTTYSRQARSENGAVTQTLFQFDAEGRITGTRSLLDAASLNGTSFPAPATAAGDLLTVNTYVPGSGNVRLVKSYGGDGGQLNVTSDPDHFFSIPSGVPLGYLERKSYSTGGLLVKSEYLDPVTCAADDTAASCQSVLTTLDQARDAWTGKVTSSSDSAGATTVYTYDVFSRLKDVTPPGGAKATYDYTNATSTKNAFVTETLKDGTLDLKKTTYEYDGIGRLKRVSSTVPEGGVTVVETRYDAEGRKASVSQPIAASAHPFSNISGGHWTSYVYDPFGRTTSVKTPDGQEATFDYTGVRVTARTSLVRTTLNQDEPQATTETYDGLGRLRSVLEKAADTSFSNTVGGDTTATYTYDAGGRLHTVVMSGGGVTQPARTFSYDRRGFLQSETHPESGTTTYSGYDARGHASTRTPATGVVVTSAFDRAERLLSVSAGGAPLKEFTYATNNSGTDLRRGKLHTAARHNYLAGAGHILVTETYAYDSPSGQPSSRTTKVEKVGISSTTPIQTFTTGMSYDKLGLLDTLTMPTCVSPCSASGGVTTVEHSRNNGLLTSVDGFGSILYHPSGMVREVEHASTPASKDTYDAVLGLPRPSSITFSGGAEESCPDAVAPVITAPAAVCAGTSGNQASVPGQTGITHTWTISAGSIDGSATGDSISFTAPASGPFTLTAVAGNACDDSAPSTKSIDVLATPAAAVITAPASTCAGSTENTASVTTRPNVVHTWSITGGTITSATMGETITFSAGTGASVTLTVTAKRSGCTAGTSSSKSVPITTAPMAAVTGGGTIVRGSTQTAELVVTLTGASPRTVTWSDGHVDADVTVSTLRRTVQPSSTTTYTVHVTSGGCERTGSGSAVVNVVPAPPAWVTATTVENRTVSLQWAAVAGASSYRVEVVPQAGGGPATFVTVAAPSTSWTYTAPASAAPMTYVYYVTSLDDDNVRSSRGAYDYATTATALFAEPVLTADVTVIRAAHVVEVRRGIDALRTAAGLAPVFATAPPPSLIRASDFTDMVTALSAARTALGYSPFVYANAPAPAPGTVVLASHVMQLREALR